MLEMYNHETYGSDVSEDNGYLVGKRWLNVQVDMWKKDIEDGLLFLFELYDYIENKINFPHWWLDKIFKT